MEVSRTRLLALRGVAFTLDLLLLIASIYAIIFLFGLTALQLSLYVLGYFCLTEWLLRGYTVGKWLCRIRVIDGNGQPPVLLQVVLRNLCRLIETNPFLLGPIPAAVIFIFSPHSQRMGDMLGRTYVIECKELAAIREQIEQAQQGAPVTRLESGLGT